MFITQSKNVFNKSDEFMKPAYPQQPKKKITLTESCLNKGRDKGSMCQCSICLEIIFNENYFNRKTDEIWSKLIRLLRLNTSYQKLFILTQVPSKLNFSILSIFLLWVQYLRYLFVKK